MGPQGEEEVEAAEELPVQGVLDLGLPVGFDPSPVPVRGRRWASEELAQALRAVRGSFMRDRASLVWDGGQPLRGETVSERVRRYAPVRMPPETWELIEPLVRRAALAAAATPYAAQTFGSVVVQLAAWCHREGLPLDDEAVLHPDVVDRFLVEGCRHLSDGTKLNYKSQLQRVGRELLGPPLYPTKRVPTRQSPPVQPYSAHEVAALLGWARGLPTTRMRDNTHALLTFGLGAGLSSQELNSLVGADIQVDDDGVVVNIAVGKPRRVAVLRRWEDSARAAAAARGHQPVFLPHRSRVNRKDILRFIDSLPTADAPRLQPTRLRVTWIVHHLRAGTPLPALEAAAAVSPTQLVRYARFLDDLDPNEARSALRNAKP